MNKVHQILHKRVHIKAWTLSELGFSIQDEPRSKRESLLSKMMLQECLVGELCDDSRNIQAGNTFLCLPRAESQAVSFVQQAIQRGATAVILVGKQVPCSIPCLYLPDMEALGSFLRRYFDTIDTTTQCIGITGTDGKTSVAWMLRHALARHLGVAWSSGTLGWVRSSEERYDLGNTTPSCIICWRQRIKQTCLLGSWKYHRMALNKGGWQVFPLMQPFGQRWGMITCKIMVVLRLMPP